MSTTYDIEFFWDPVCPWAWITSRWVTEVAKQRDLSVDWRFISLRLLNKAKNYETDFPDGYIAGHGSGLKLLRVAAQSAPKRAASRWRGSTPSSAETSTSDVGARS